MAKAKPASITSEILKAYYDINDKAMLDLQAELQMCIKDVLGTASGQKLLWWILARTGALTSTYTGNADSYYLAGAHDFGLEMFHRMNAANPAVVLKMTQSETIFSGGNDE